MAIKIKKEIETKKRPTFLNVWLGIMLGGIILGLGFIFVIGLLNLAESNFVSPVLWFSFITSILDLVFIYLLYNWKIVGFYGITTMYIINFLATLLFNPSYAFFVAFSFIGLLVLYFAMRPVWKEFN